MGRFVRLVGVFVAAALDYRMHVGARADFPQRAAWLHRWSRAALRAVAVSVASTGPIPRTGILVSNHLGYVDILVLGALTPQVFLSKAEVRRWPVLGWYARMAGTQFIERERRADVARQNAEFARIVETHAVQTIFLEGTSSDGTSVLPFRSSLLEPAVVRGWPITPAAVVFVCSGGDPRRDVCWWGKMGLAGHAWRFLRLDAIHAQVAFGPTRRPGTDRKTLAAQLHAEVVQLRRDAEEAALARLPPAPMPAAATPAERETEARR